MEAPRRTEIPPKSPVRKTSSAALPKEDEDVFSLMPIKERKRIFEELARQGERNRLNQRFFKLRVSTRGAQLHCFGGPKIFVACPSAKTDMFS